MHAVATAKNEWRLKQIHRMPNGSSLFNAAKQSTNPEGAVDAWEAVRMLESGYEHTAAVRPSRFYQTGSSGPLTTSDEQSVTVLAAFFEKLFNRASSYDGAYILARVPQRATLWHLADPPSHTELIAALHASPGCRAPQSAELS